MSKIDQIRTTAEALEDGDFDRNERFDVAVKLRQLAAMADGIEAVA